jgi:hypothetical protein
VLLYKEQHIPPFQRRVVELVQLIYLSTTFSCRGVTLLRDPKPGEVDAEGVLLSAQIGPVSYRHDQRLLIPSYRYFSKEQVCCMADDLDRITYDC